MRADCSRVNRLSAEPLTHVRSSLDANDVNASKQASTAPCGRNATPQRRFHRTVRAECHAAATIPPHTPSCAKLTPLGTDNPFVRRKVHLFGAHHSARAGAQMCEAPAIEIMSEETLTQLFASENRALMRIAVRITRDVDDASDAVQTGFLRACECANRLNPEHVRGWLRVVVRRVAIDIVRARSKTLGMDQFELLNVGAPPKELEPPWMSYRFDDIDRALVSCPAPIRNVFRLWWSGFSYKAMAQRLSIPAATVATRVLRAKNRIRHYYRDS